MFAEVLRRLLKTRYSEIENDHTNDAVIVGNIKCLVASMRLHGNNSSEQSNFLENIALAVSGDISMAILEASTGLSSWTIEHGREMRENFNSDVRKADDLLSINPVEDSERVLFDTAYDSDESDVDSLHSADHGAEDSQHLKHLESKKSRKRNRNRGNGDNIFRDFFAAKTRKVRCDKKDKRASLLNKTDNEGSKDAI